MNLATGAMGSLLPKLVELLSEEYNLQTSVKEAVGSLSRELTNIEGALGKVADVPRDQLDGQVRLWADNVRELTYEMEDAIDSFMVRVDGGEPAHDPKRLKRIKKKITKFVKKGKTRHQIAKKIQDIKVRVKEVSDLRDRYKVDDICANPAATPSFDPRILALFRVHELVGIDEPKAELIKRLRNDQDVLSKRKLKMLSISGFGGLGKTTLAKAVYDDLRPEFDHRAFVSVGRNPDPKNVLKEIFLEVDRAEYSGLQASTLSETQLMKQLQRLLQNKRYFIVIDDVWDIRSWEIISCAFTNNNCGSIIMTTTRISEVAQNAGDVYKLAPLSPGTSKELFYKRLSIGHEGNKSNGQLAAEVSEKILQKCGGVPLAIITIASLLVDKQRGDWPEVYNSIGFGDGDNEYVHNTRKILLYSYYDLPHHLRSCLLHLSIYPEDYEIQKDTLIWKWAAEGLIPEKPGLGLFEVGERYFTELVNRNMIQPVEIPYQSIITGCRLHDLVLDMIYSLSKEEKFVTILDNNEQQTCPPSNARRLAIQKRVTEQHGPVVSTPMPQVRSLYAIMCDLRLIPSLSSFNVLRILAFEQSKYDRDHRYQIEHLGKLLHLRYIEFSGMVQIELPEEIGDLKFLQTLDLRGTTIDKLPQSISQLRQLKCLRLKGTGSGVSDWIGNLTSLEELSLDYVCHDIVKELGKLTELRVFKAGLILDSMEFKYLMDSLSNLQRLQAIDIFQILEKFADWEGYVPSRHLRHLIIMHLPTLVPAWINSSRVPLLSHLELYVESVKAHDVEFLGKLPELLTLQMYPRDNIFPDVIGGGAFPKLRYFYASTWSVRFLQGAMPSVEFVSLYIANPRETANLERDIASMGNLTCLQKVKAHISCNNVTVQVKAKVAFGHVVKVHPNSPIVDIICSQPLV